MECDSMDGRFWPALEIPESADFRVLIGGPHLGSLATQSGISSIEFGCQLADIQVGFGKRLRWIADMGLIEQAQSQSCSVTAFL